MRHVAAPMPDRFHASPYCAYLRVYEPLIAFDDAERAAWQHYAGTAEPRSQRLSAEHRSALAGVLSIPPRPVPAEETREAFVLEAAGTLHVCPVQTRLRSWMALGQFRDGLPESLLHAFVPPASLARAEADHARWGGSAAGASLRILTATWSVPIHWFVAFTPGDREVRADPAEVVLRTRMSAARRRVGRALRTLRRAVGEITYVDDLEDVGRWLEDFHPRSWLELDYGGLARVLGRDGLAADTSVEEVAGALDALAEGDEPSAAAAYQQVVARWARVRALEHAN
jgi:hypothetical protein